MLFAHITINGCPRRKVPDFCMRGPMFNIFSSRWWFRGDMRVKRPVVQHWLIIMSGSEHAISPHFCRFRLRSIQEKHDWERVRADCQGFAREALRQIETLTGIPSYYPNDSWYVQMFAAPLPNSVNISRFKKRLYDKYQIEAPVHEWNAKKLIRISNSRIQHNRGY